MAKKKRALKEIIAPLEKVGIRLDGRTLFIKGPKGELTEDIADPLLDVRMDGNNVVITGKTLSRKEKKKLKTHKARLKNKMIGVKEGYLYRLKICSGHFPMNVGVSGGQFVVKNFLGEKVPRAMKIKHGASVKIEGDIVTVEGIDKNLTGQVAADIEQLTRVTNKDLRVFQDGIYIIEKAGKEIK